MKIQVFDFEKGVLTGENVESSVLDGQINALVVSHVVRWQMAKRRRGCSKTKGISDIKATTRKPHAQKGTGRARQGSLVSPQFRGGAVIFGPVVRDHSFKINKKVRKLALRMVLSEKCDVGNLHVVDKNIAINEISKLRKFMNKCFFGKKVLFVGNVGCEFKKAINNLSNISVLPVVGLNVYDVMHNDIVVLLSGSLSCLESRF